MVMAKAKERRTTPRCIEWKGNGNLSAEVRVGAQAAYAARVVNISQKGTLLEFRKPAVPQVRVDEQITVKLWLREDAVWLPGIVRHCYAKRIGVFFPRGLGKSIPNARQILNKMLRSSDSRKSATQPG